MSQMTLDKAGEDLIKGFEALKLSPYLDIHGKPTIGWGHTSGVTMDTLPITEDQAEAFFTEDVITAEESVNGVTIELTQNEFNALVSFVFNEGGWRFLTSSLFTLLNLGDRQGAAKQFDRWVYYHDKLTGSPRVSSDLVKRRAKEKALFLKDFESARTPSPVEV